MKNIAIASFCILTLSSCVMRSPYDYYYKLAFIEKAGQSIRADKGRKAGEKVEPVVEEKSFIVDFYSNDDEFEEVKVAGRDGQVRGPSSFFTEKRLSITGVNLKSDQLNSLLKGLGVNVVKVETVDGRLVGAKNSVQVSFVPREKSDEGQILVEFSMICGAVYGFDKDQTVDVITAFAESRESLLPYMVIQADILDFIEASEGKISQKEWIERIIVRRL